MPPPYKGINFRGSPEGKIVQSAFQRDNLGPTEVLIRITHSGLCYTDIHGLNFDLVLGHEGVGIVEAVGSSVQRFTIGERAGWGYIHETCGSCRECLTGNEVICDNRHEFLRHDFDQGSLGEIAVWKEDWLFKIPEAMKSEHAAPLMCGGATVFTPLVEHVKPTSRVGIIGIGGLGHLAVQFANKMGCEVIVFSGSDSKREEALSLGATEFYATKGVADLSTLGLPKPVDVIIATSATLPDWKSYFKVLSVGATIIPLTVDPTGDMRYPHMHMITHGYKVIGSILAGRQMQNDMLAFAARHNVFPVIETFPMTKEGVTTAVGRLLEGKMRYRGVLVAN